MARSKGALALLLLLSSQLSSSSHAATTTLVDSTGSLNKASSLPPTTFKEEDGSSSSGVVALLTSPGTTGSLFPPVTTVSVDGSILTAPGASLEESTGLARGIGAAAAGTLADAIVLGGVTMGDIETGLAGTRHGRTLAELFSSVLKSKKSGTASTLIVAVEEASGDASSSSSSLDTDSIKENIEEIFDGVAALVLGVNDEKLNQFFKVEVTLVKNSEDVTKVMDQAAKAAATSSTKSSSSVMGSKPFSTAFSEIYSTLSSSPDYADPTPVAEAILACTDAYSRAFGMSRAKIASWKHRVSRGLLVDKFGMNADSLFQRTLDLFDRDTMAAAGLPAAGEQRLVIRQRLQQRMEKTLKDLFDVQMGILEKSTLKKFNHSLLKKMGKDGLDNTKFFEDNATALRTSLFAFETSAALLEIPSLSLTKSNAVRDVTGKLNNALMTFPDSPAAKIKAMKKVEQTVSKKKKPSEGSIDLALDVVAMIRPDGFGNLQGFAGYQLGPHSVTVGVHNDADDPQVIAQFGGVRPPFIRVQPKLKLDVEL